MVTLKQVTTTTTSSAWSSFNSANGATGRGSVPNPSYPIFFFDYQTTQIAVGYVVGTNGYAYESQADANYLVVPSLPLTFLGLNYVLGGGGECGPANSCMGNGADVCGPWWYVLNTSNNTVTTPCNLIPSNPQTEHLDSILADLINQNLLMTLGQNEIYNMFIFIIPFASLSSFVSGTYPSTATWYYAQCPNTTNGRFYTNSPTIYNGNLWVPLANESFAGEWVIPLSTVYSGATTGAPSSSSSPISIGTVYTVSTTMSGANTSIATVIAISSSSGLTFYIAHMVTQNNANIFVATLNPSDGSVVNTGTFTVVNSGSTVNDVKGTFNGVFLYPAQSGSTAYLYAIDPKIMTIESTSVTGYFAFVGSEGYFVVATTSLSSSSVSWTVYQVLLDNTYIFQNTSITISGTTVTATGTLYNETTSSAVSGATVYLVGVNSLDDNYSNDVDVITSGTTNSNGQFNISGTYSSSYKYYGVLYVP